MKRSTAAWSVAGVVTGFAGLATSYLAAKLVNAQYPPVVAVLDSVRDLAPGGLANWARDNLGHASKVITTVLTLLILGALFAWFGRLSARAGWRSTLGWVVLAGIGLAAVMTEPGWSMADLVPLAVGLVTWTLATAVLAARLHKMEAETAPEAERQRSRREFLAVVGTISAVAGVSALLGRLGLGGKVEEQAAEQSLLRLDVTRPTVPTAVRLGAEGAQPWMTPADEFYLIDTAFSRPVILAEEWSLRIHGLVENEIVLDYNDLVSREITEDWITLNCVSNEVGGDLVGNAWWSGVLLGPLLAAAKPLDGADAVLQTSADGWTCGTPLEALTDGRNAMLAVAMNGEPLPREHGYPVRTIVPGLYGYVSATKWVIDFEVTRFDDISAYWTERGWAELGPVKMASRIEVPADGAEVALGAEGAAGVVVAGTAWHQHTGIDGVEVAVDGGAWQSAEIGGSPNDDTWVQWKATLDLAPGDHVVRVRAIDKAGEVQTGAEADVLPDGSTGWHEVGFSVTAADA